MMRKRIDLAGDATARQELWRRSRVCWSATSATSTRRSPPASASSTRARRTTRRWRRWRGSTSSRGGTASGWRSSSAAWRSRPRATRTASGCCGQIASLLEGPLGDPGEALGRWREVLEAAPGDATAMAALERFLAPATDGGLRLSAAQALEPIYERAGRFAELAAVVRVYVDAQTDARARLEQLMRLAALEETRAR